VLTLVTAQKCGGECGEEARDRRKKGQLSEADRRRCVKQSKSFEQELVVSREEYKWCYNSQQAAKMIDEETDEERSCEELRGRFERNETNDTALEETHNRIDALAMVVQWDILHNRWKQAIAIVVVGVNCGQGTLASFLGYCVLK